MSHSNSDFTLDNMGRIQAADERFIQNVNSLLHRLANPNMETPLFEPEFRRAVHAAVREFLDYTSRGQRPIASISTLLEQTGLWTRINLYGRRDLVESALTNWTMFQDIPEQEHAVPGGVDGGAVAYGQESPVPWQGRTPEGYQRWPEATWTEAAHQQLPLDNYSHHTPPTIPNPHPFNSPRRPQSTTNITPPARQYHFILWSPSDLVRQLPQPPQPSLPQNPQPSSAINRPVHPPSLLPQTPGQYLVNMAAPAGGFPATSSTTNTTTTTNSATNPVTNTTTTTNANNGNAAATTQGQGQAASIIPADLELRNLIRPDDMWGLECDLCGYARKQIGEINRHIRDGSGGARPGFKIVAADPNHTSMRWYGRDNNGREYSGRIINYDRDGPYRTAPPCRDNVSRRQR